MKLLAIETSLESCSVGLLNQHQIHEVYEFAPQQQTKLVLSMIDGLLFAHHLKLENLDALVFSCGPGNFTGIRIAAGVIQGLGMASDLPVIPVSTLQLLAQQAFQEYQFKKCAVCLDARLQDVYYCEFQLDENNIMQPLISEKLIASQDLKKPKNDLVMIGNGWKYLHDNDLQIYELQPHAANLIRLGQYYFAQKKYTTAANALPVYLRGNEIWKKQN